MPLVRAAARRHDDAREAQARSTSAGVTPVVTKEAAWSRRLIGLLVVAALVATSGGILWAVSGGSGSRPAQEETSRRTDGNSATEPADAHTQAYLRKACGLPERWIRAIDRGWVRGPARARDIIIVPRPPNYMGTFINTSHSGPYDFLQEVPLVFYGPGYIKDLGRWNPGREVTVADIAPTQAAIMGFQWPRREGRAITEIIKEGGGPPALVLTVSIDGGGWNVLQRWPHAWPNLAELMRSGTSIESAIVGSSPSITPATHTNMSTSAFPRRHGVSAIAIRGPQGAIQGAFARSPNETRPPVNPDLNLRVTTLAEDWDRTTGNRAEVGLLASGNYVLGLIGSGARLGGGDRDIAALLAGDGRWETDARFYRLPSYVNSFSGALRDEIDALDNADGRADGKWLGHDLGDTSVNTTPAIASYERRIAQSVIEGEGFGRDGITDLLYLHYKSPDHVGHKWNMISREMDDVLASVDAAVGSLVQWLDANVGAERYVMVVTADHGQTPLEAGGWPLSRDELLRDVGESLDTKRNGEGILERTSATSLFSNVKEMRANGVTPADVASFLSDYTIGDNVADGSAVPDGFEDRADEPILAAAFPGRRLDQVKSCVRAGS
jgi:hypothetical protein